MQLLKPDQIATWYKYSIEKSGYKDLSKSTQDIWKEVITSGNTAFPPGFLARLVAMLMSVAAGTLSENSKSFPIEDEIFQILSSANGFERLEGLFILSGADRDLELGKNYILQLIERLPSFQCYAMTMTVADVEKSFSSPASGGVDSSRLLNETYQSFINQLKEEKFFLTSIDIFEIGHPELFQKTSDRILYRRMMRATRGILKWTQAVFTLKEESNWIVAKYGEPQVLPLGGYDAISNKGTISSLVPSELAYMDEEMEFDLFDYKFLEKQLMYYQRDSGAIFRIRRDIRIVINLTEFFEHERHLGLLFAWCLNLAEKLIDIFVKDLVNIYLEFKGYEPSSLKEGCSFIRHFIAEKKLDERIYILTIDNQVELRENAQIWFVGKTPPRVSNKDSNMRFVPCIYPQSEEFVKLSFDEQERVLGLLINNVVEGIVGNADS